MKIQEKIERIAGELQDQLKDLYTFVGVDSSGASPRKYQASSWKELFEDIYNDKHFDVYDERVDTLIDQEEYQELVEEYTNFCYKTIIKPV